MRGLVPGLWDCRGARSSSRLPLTSGADRRNVRALWDLLGVAVKDAPKAEDGFSMVKAAKKAKAKTKALTQRAQSLKLLVELWI